MYTIFDSHGQNSMLKDRDGQKIEVIKDLPTEQAVINDVGMMYKVRFEDGFEANAFEDEIYDFVKEMNGFTIRHTETYGYEVRSKDGKCLEDRLTLEEAEEYCFENGEKDTPENKNTNIER